MQTTQLCSLSHLPPFLNSVSQCRPDRFRSHINLQTLPVPLFPPLKKRLTWVRCRAEARACWPNRRPNRCTDS